MSLTDASSITYNVVSVIAVTLNSLLVYSMIKIGGKFTVKKLNLFTGFLAISSFLWAFCYGSMQIYVSSQKDKKVEGNSLPCDLIGISNNVGGGMTMFFHVLLALDRYYIITKGRELPNIIALIMAVFWTAMTLIIAMLNLAIRGHASQPMLLGSWCFTQMYEDAPAGTTTALIPGYLLMFYMGSNVCIIVIIYTFIVLDVYRRRSDNKSAISDSSAQGSANSPTKTTFFQHDNKIELKTLKGCIQVSALFAISYTPVILIFFYALVSQQKYPLELEYFASITGVLDGVWTPIVLLRMNATLRKKFLETFPVPRFIAFYILDENNDK